MRGQLQAQHPSPAAVPSEGELAEPDLEVSIGNCRRPGLNRAEVARSDGLLKPVLPVPRGSASTAVAPDQGSVRSFD